MLIRLVLVTRADRNVSSAFPYILVLLFSIGSDLSPFSSGRNTKEEQPISSLVWWEFSLSSLEWN
jgi:hypothetical protein